MITPKTLFGIDKLLQQSESYKNFRFGLITNNAALTSTGELSRVALIKKGFNVVKLFSPEHGLNAKGADGSFQKNIKDKITGLPVISLYGDSLTLQSNDLIDIDYLVFDIPDVGSRFYTYLWTLTYAMEACASFNKPLLIADRPNPLSGNLDLIEGPMLDEKNCSSFIGRWNIPIRHSCTYGELANYFSVTRKIETNLTIIKSEYWNRPLIAEKEWKFTSTSPAINDIETALLYTGMGLFEGINVNEGRGTNFPFKIFGAPWIDAEKLLKEFLHLSLPGIHTEITEFIPSEFMYSNQVCYGLKLHVSDAELFKPVLAGLKMIELIQVLFPEDCEERLYKTVANPTGKNHLDKLTGVLNAFEKIKTGEMFNHYYHSANWKETITPYLLY